MTDRIRKALGDLKARQDTGEHMPCPRCGRDTMKKNIHTNALSRHADIYICDACGTEEALLKFMHNPLPMHEWACFRPTQQPSDFKMLTAEAIWERVQVTQIPFLMSLYERCQEEHEYEDFNDYRAAAFESCPGLTQMWERPFRSEYAAADGKLVLRFRLTNLPETLEELLAFLHGLECPPSIIVHSGNGLHTYWLLQEYTVVDDENRGLIKRIMKGHEMHTQKLGREHGWKFDSVADLARVLRVPGTVNGLPEIVEEEAEVVRAIYKCFLEGDTICMITKKLNQQRIPSPAEKKKLTASGDEQEKKTKWCSGTVESILTNEKYKGDALLQKTYCTDFLTKKMKVNEGEVPQYYVQDSHPAIVDADIFDLVQIELARRKALKGQYSGNGCFASRIVCGDCGHFYGSKVWHSNDQYRKVVWRCNHKYNGQQKCTSPHVTQETLECAFEEVMRRMIAQREHVIAACRLAVKEVLDADDLRIEQEGLEEKLLLLNERIRRLVNDNARTEMNLEEYQREYDALSVEYRQATDRIREIDEELSSREARKKRIELFLRMFEKQEADVEFDPGVFVAMVERVVVQQKMKSKCIGVKCELRNGQEWKIRFKKGDDAG